MNTTSETLEETQAMINEVVEADAEQDIQARLKAIADALAAKNPELAAAPRAAFTCPIDPAERAACDSCQ